MSQDNTAGANLSWSSGPEVLFLRAFGLVLQPPSSGNFSLSVSFAATTTVGRAGTKKGWGNGGSRGGGKGAPCQSTGVLIYEQLVRHLGAKQQAQGNNNQRLNN